MKYIYLPSHKMQSINDSNVHLYVGSHTCIYNLPDIERLPYEAVKRITLITPPVPQKSLSHIKEYIFSFIQKVQFPEIVVNDWGLIHWFTKNMLDYKIPISLGFILTHQKRDPFKLLSADNSAGGIVAETKPDCQKLLKSFDIKSIEVTPTFQELRVPNDFKFSITTYKPLSFLSFTRHCPFLRAYLKQNDNMINMSCSGSYCRNECYSYTINIKNLEVVHYYIGNAQWYFNSGGNTKADRIVDNSALIF